MSELEHLNNISLESERYPLLFLFDIIRQCQQFQKNKDLSKYASVVVLDEVGLAEDSPKMPLKTLHPLLEDGCINDEDSEPHKKVRRHRQEGKIQSDTI